MNYNLKQQLLADQGYITPSGFVIQSLMHFNEQDQWIKTYRIAAPYHGLRTFLTETQFTEHINWNNIDQLTIDDILRRFDLTGYIQAGVYEVYQYVHTKNWIKVRNPLGLEVDMEYNKYFKAHYFERLTNMEDFIQHIYASSSPTKFKVQPMRPKTYIENSNDLHEVPPFQYDKQDLGVNAKYGQFIHWDDDGAFINNFNFHNVHGVEFDYQYNYGDFDDASVSFP